MVAQAVAGHGEHPAFRVGGDALGRPSDQGTLQRVGDGVLGGGNVAAARGEQRQQSAVAGANQLGDPGLRLTQGYTSLCRWRR